MWKGSQSYRDKDKQVRKVSKHGEDLGKQYWIILLALKILRF